MQTKGLSTLVAVVASLVILFMWNAHGQGVKAMQMWEYKALVYATPAVGLGSAILYEDGKQTSGTPISRAPDLGAQGWEMVSMAAVATSGGNLQYFYWFKRPK